MVQPTAEHPCVAEGKEDEPSGVLEISVGTPSAGDLLPRAGEKARPGGKATASAKLSGSFQPKILESLRVLSGRPGLQA